MNASSGKSLLNLAVGSLFALAPLWGCDYLDTATGRADRGVEKRIQEAQLLQTEGNQAEALATLQKAVEDKAAGEVSRARALSALAESEYAAARDEIASINANQVQISRLLSEIDNLGAQIRNINQAVAAQQKRDPVEARKEIAALIASAKGGADQPDWFEHEQAPLPTLSKVKQDISNLDSQIVKLQEQVKNLEERRNELLKQADAALRQSDTETGQESVDLFKKGSGLRKQASDLSNDIDQANAALVPLRHARAIAREQEEILNGVVKGFEQQLTELEAGWKKVQEQILAQQALARRIAEGTDGGTEPTGDLKVASSIAGKSAILSELLDANADSLESALQNLHNAASHFGAAASAAEALQAELTRKMRDAGNTDAAEQPAWKQLSAVMSPMHYRLRQAAVEQTLAGVQAARSQILGEQLSVAKALEQAYQASGLELPEALDGDLQQRRDEAYADATRSYEQAAELLNTIVESPSAANVRSAAMVAQVLTQYGWYRLETSAGNQQDAQEHLQLARSIAQDAQGQNIPMPSLPPELRGIQASASPTQGTSAH